MNNFKVGDLVRFNNHITWNDDIVGTFAMILEFNGEEHQTEQDSYRFAVFSLEGIKNRRTELIYFVDTREIEKVV